MCLLLSFISNLTGGERQFVIFIFISFGKITHPGAEKETDNHAHTHVEGQTQRNVVGDRDAVIFRNKQRMQTDRQRENIYEMNHRQKEERNICSIL